MDQASGAGWTFFNGDSCEVLADLPDHSIDMAIFSPPFSSTYTYSPSDRDLGNVSSDVQFFEQFTYITRELKRVVKPGRLIVVHVADLPAYENTHGYSGRRDFSGDVLRHFMAEGFLFHSRVTIDKNPQAQAIRTHSKGLLFVQLQRDAAAMWQAWADYLLVLRTPGKNAEPVKTDLTQEDWIDFARPIWAGNAAEDQVSADWTAALEDCWYGIRETDVLSTRMAKDNEDERHLAPLQLPVIERAVRLWSNRGDVILSPFGGIASEGVGALRHGRRFVGIELKPAYWRAGVRNLQQADAQAADETLFSADGEPGGTP